MSDPASTIAGYFRGNRKPEVDEEEEKKKQERAKDDALASMISGGLSKLYGKKK